MHHHFTLLFCAAIATTMSVFVSSTTSSSLHDLLKQVSKLSMPNQRAVAAVVGASVGDAATRPFHWVYDRAKLEKTVGDKDPAYWPVSVSPFYTLPTGRRSCYNDLGICMLTAMNTAPADAFVEETYVKTMSSFFSPESEYAVALKRRKEAYTPEKRMEDREPIDGPWQQGAVSNFLSCLEKGEPIAGSPESKETDGLCTTIPLIARLAAEEAATASSSSATRDSEVIISAARLLSSNPFALRHTLAASRVLRNIVLNGASGVHWDAVRYAVLDGENDIVIPGGKTIMMSVEKAAGATTDDENKIEVDYLLEEMNQVAIALNSQEYHTNAVERWGRQCANPGSFQGAILAVTSSTSFEEGIRKVILAGGCNCSRANFAGACLGAAYGFQLNDGSDTSPGIPFSWIEKCDRAEDILRMALEKVVVSKS